jgi:hypothetical protein
MSGYRLVKPIVDLEAQGRLLRVHTTLDDCEIRRGGGGRGNVTEFSSQSRVRLFRLISRLKTPQHNGYRSKVSFLTLTTREILHPRVFKVLLFRLFRRLRRTIPGMAVVWRLEYQKRGAPHAHCILYNAPYIDKIALQSDWGKIVGEELPFTRIELVRAYKTLMAYVSKYVGKVSRQGGFNSVTYSDRHENVSAAELESAGRVWGVYNRAALPYDEILMDWIPQDGGWYMIRAYCRKFYPFLEEFDNAGFTVFCDDPYHALKHIVKLARTFGPYK